MKNVLFLVTGMTPQIITETLWALACDTTAKESWVPDEIHVLSTEDGLNQIRSRLFGQKEGYRFDKFKQQYEQLRHVKFDDSSQYLHVFTNKQGEILTDLRTPADNEIAANKICKMIRDFCQDDDVTLHVSIAGGRKTMGFYAGYALSLYGREQDHMSHVLVDEPYETARDFFYPTLDDADFITNRDGKELKTKDAKVWLAKIPFVRMRHQLTDEKLMADLSFSEIVDFINSTYDMPVIKISNNDKTIVVGNKKSKLSPKEFSLYLLAVEMNHQQKTLVYPSKDILEDSIQPEAQQRFNQIYNQHKTKRGQDEVIMDYENFGQALSKIKGKFRKDFGSMISEKICIKKLDNGGYGIALDSKNIIIKDGYDRLKYSKINKGY